MEMNEWNTLAQYREFRSREEGSKLLVDLINRGILPEVDMEVALHRYVIDMAVKNKQKELARDKKRKADNLARAKAGKKPVGRPRKY